MSERYTYEFGCDGYYIIDTSKLWDYDPEFTDKDEYRAYQIENCLEGQEVCKLLNKMNLIKLDKEELLNQLDDCKTYILLLEEQLESLGVEIK